MSHRQATARAADVPRRTVTITGRPERRLRLVEVERERRQRPRLVEFERRRPARRPVERLGPRPDRIAMWAFVMALFLILVTLLSH